MLAFDLAIKKTLQSVTHRFELDICLQSASQCLAVVGPSGSGKTLLLKHIAGLSSPDEGYIRLGDQLFFDSSAGVCLKPQQRKAAYLFQQYNLFPHLTVQQNIGFALNKGLFNHARFDNHPAVIKWLGIFELDKVAKLYPHQLSGGQQQRVALARALVIEPTVLLLDEPFSALDQQLRQKLRQEMKTLQQQLTIPMLLISHDVADVEFLAEHVFYINNGQLVDQPFC